MNITDQLESIMLKIANVFPAFEDYLKVKKLIRQYFQALPSDSCILLLGSRKTDIEYAEYLMRDNQDYKSLVVDIFTDKKIDLSAVGAFDKVVIVSYFSMMELSHALAMIDIESECLYDYFVLNGVILQHNWYDYILVQYRDSDTYKVSYDFRYCTGYRELYYERKMYGYVKGDELKAFHLRRMIFICLHTRDFIYAKRYIDEYAANGYVETEQLISTWNEVEALLDQIKDELLSKTERDTIMFWLDALEYGDDKNMPFLKGLTDHTMVFENAFTVTPYTSPTLKTILTGKKVIDDKSYQITKISNENSPFIRVLETYGVDFVYYGLLSDYMDKPYRLQTPSSNSTPTGSIFWTALEKLLSCESPICLMVHELNQSHSPFVSSVNDADTVFFAEDFQYYSKIDPVAIEKQRQESLYYLDEQIALFSTMLPTVMNKIYFSDHGRSFNGRYHTYLKVNADKICRKSHDNIFSYLDWDKLMRWIYDPKEQPLGSVFREYALIQDIDFYNDTRIKLELTGEDSFGVTRFLSYRGVITRDEVFILRSDGFERFYNRKANRPPISPTRLDELRCLSGNYFIDPFSDPHFKYSRYFYKAIKNYLSRTGSYEQNKTAAIRRLFATDKKIAIRTGGEAAYQVLLRLIPDLHQNVKYIIDRDCNCLSGKFSGIEVINIDEARQLPIDTIIMPSSIWKDSLKSERYGTAQVIDLNEYLTGLGFSQNSEFWEYEITAEDIDFDIED